jgi:hypothetical protein
VVKKLKEERDILKNAAAYFARESNEIRLHFEAPFRVIRMRGGADVAKLNNGFKPGSLGWTYSVSASRFSIGQGGINPTCLA